MSSNDTTKTKSDTVSQWTEYDITLMANLIPLLYKDVLRLDSCRADAKILDSINYIMWEIITDQKVSLEMQYGIINILNAKMDRYKFIIDIKDKRIKLVKKRSFWRGFSRGLAVGGGTILLVLLILL